jgi:predicted Zn-dependent protease
VVEFFSFAEDERPGFCVSSAGQAVMGRVTERLAAFSDSPFPFDVRVLDLDMVNAIALPGGPIIIFRGLLDQAQSSDELAGVLAHEMSHVARRHAMERLMEALGLSFIFGVMLGDIGSGVLVASGEVMANLSFSRRAEAEADDGAIVLLQKNGISTQGLADFFERLSGEEGSLLEIISTHPVSAGRARKFADLANDAAPALSAEDWQALRRICETTSS